MTTDSIAAVLNDPETFLARRDLRFKNSRVVTIVRVPPLCPGNSTLVLRRLNYGKLKHRLRDIFRPSRAQRALRLGLELEQIGIPTARAIAAADGRCCRWPLRAYLITEKVPDAVTLARHLAANGSVPNAAVLELARILARLHQNGFSHRDLKATNILLDTHLQPCLIDLDGLRHYGLITEKRAVADLARLYRGLTVHPHFLRKSGWLFLRTYCRERHLAKRKRHMALEIISSH